MKKRLLKADIEHFEKLSKIGNAHKLVKELRKLGFNEDHMGASTMVFLARNIDYVVKIGDNMDMIPRKTSRFHKYYARILWRSKNKKMVIQQKVNMSERSGNKAIKIISKKTKLDIFTLDDKYDIRIFNVGMRNNRPKIIDYRNYSSKGYEFFATTPCWCGLVLEGRRFN